MLRTDDPRKAMDLLQQCSRVEDAQGLGLGDRALFGHWVGVVENRSDVILYALLVLEEGLVEQRRQIVPGPHFDRHITAVEGNLLACRQLRDRGERWLAAGDHQPFNKIGSRGCKDLGNVSTHGVTHEMGVVDAELRAQLEPVPGQHLQSIGS
ncbi:MAG: hypothetical protein R6U00_11045, partial [Prochlorococcaceae cyanobacterium]